MDKKLLNQKVKVDKVNNKLVIIVLLIQAILVLTIQAQDPLQSTYFVEAGSYGTKRETDPPSYVRNLSKSGIKGTENMDWLDVGLDYRARFEIRHQDIRRPEIVTDYPLLLRTRAYLGVKNLTDPFRFAIEFEDAHRVNGKFAPDSRDFNRAELIQAYADLHFKEALGKDDLGNSRPILIRFGRQAFEFLDRRLIALNSWRNTTNNFLGVRAAVGQEKNDWQVDVLAVRPINRLIDEFDQTDHNLDFWAIMGHWRKWSDALTIEPYYMGLKQRPAAGNNSRERLIHSPGIRFYGWVSNKSFDYDLTYTQQFGNDNGLDHNAFAVTAELGYKLSKLRSKPRVSLSYGYVSGDKDPNDMENNRFERFFGLSCASLISTSFTFSSTASSRLSLWSSYLADSNPFLKESFISNALSFASSKMSAVFSAVLATKPFIPKDALLKPSFSGNVDTFETLEHATPTEYAAFLNTFSIKPCFLDMCHPQIALLFFWVYLFILAYPVFQIRQ